MTIEGISCLADCDALCCRRDQGIVIYSKEDYMTLGGGEFLKADFGLAIFGLMYRGPGRYILTADCQHLEGKKCQIYPDEISSLDQRPQACQGSKVGDRFCFLARLKDGLT